MLKTLNVRVRATLIVLALLPAPGVALAPSNQDAILSFPELPETTRNALVMVARAEAAAHAEASSVLALRAAALMAEAAGTYLEAAVGVRALKAMDAVPVHLHMSRRDQASVRRRLSDTARNVASASSTFRSLTDEVLAEAVRARDLENPRRYRPIRGADTCGRGRGSRGRSSCWTDLRQRRILSAWCGKRRGGGRPQGDGHSRDHGDRSARGG